MGIIREALEKLEKFTEEDKSSDLIKELKSLDSKIKVQKYKRAKDIKVRGICHGTGFGVDLDFKRENSLIDKAEELAKKHNVKLDIKHDPNYGVLFLDFIV